MTGRRLIVVSNRGPVSYARDEHGVRVAGRGGGGLATALRGLAGRCEVTWIASAISEEDRAVAAESGGALEHELGGTRVRLVLLAHDPAAYDRYYNVVANPLLWFVHHSLWELGRTPVLDAAFAEAWRDGYVRVNESYAAAVVAELDNDPDAAVFFHDYHLYLAPRLVRDARPDAVLAHFLHVPWPQSDGWTVLPLDARRAIHDGLLANDVVGLHTSRWTRNFVASAADVLGADVEDGRLRHRGRRTAVAARPISIDCAEFDELAESPAVLAAEAAIERTRAERLVLRVDRTDPSKNIVRGCIAFGLLLDRHPEWRGRAQLLALLDPSRQDIPEYVDYLAAVERETAAVNARHAGAIDLRVSDDFPFSVAAYKQYDVLLVNAVFDGLNLVAKEGPVVNRRDGVLVLSENAGAHEELGEWAVTVNPFDVLGQAEALHAALSMDGAERARRAGALASFVRVHDIGRWIDAQLADLAAVAR
ncbi:MAG TPA: trehalose-6-phosphate synthase [Gaiellaceae bacterium]|nr:trehalose-6-phosphate synthase [Gaiellaceae bacterium]